MNPQPPHTTLSQALFLALALGLVALCSTASAQDSEAEIKQILAQFQQTEPSVLDVQKAALRYAMIDSGTMDSWRTRARFAHIIPGKIQAKYVRDDLSDGRTQARETLVPQDEEDPTSPFNVSSIQNTVYDDFDKRERIEVRGDWELNKLIFNDDELSVAKEVVNQAKFRQQVLNTITKLYFERRRLQVERILKPSDNAVKALRSQLRIEELTADIDALTGGWFSGQLR